MPKSPKPDGSGKTPVVYHASAPTERFTSPSSESDGDTAADSRRVEEMQKKLGSERFRLEGLLGCGGMGAVYSAFDMVRGERVALKTMDNIDAASIWHFKQEFRALSDVSHRGIVSLYELISVDDFWFFTMELIDGQDFLSYLRNNGREKPGYQYVNRDRLRPALSQLVIAIDRLHESGHIHRDIKPSNIIVTAEGRVVILDFGVILEMSNSPQRNNCTDRPGTPAYMAPELLLEAKNVATSATDWYSLGVVLYLTLSGSLPISDRTQLQEMADNRLKPTPLSELCPEAPADLVALCMSLLEWNHKDRPQGPEIVKILGATLLSEAALTPVPEVATSLLIGRSAELQALRSSLDKLKGGQGVSVLISGNSGMGKSVLLRHFLDEIEYQEDVAVFSGRCYERESVPYKALDSMVDSISEFFLHQSEEEIRSALPVDLAALLTAFPALRRVPTIDQSVANIASVQSGFDLQRRVFGALRELLAKLSRTRLLVVAIDDLQWGDMDSVPFLSDLLCQSEFPLLFVCSYRAEDEQKSDVLQNLLGSMCNQRLASGGAPLRMELSPIPSNKLKELAQSLLPPDALASAGRIAKEARGNPYFVHEMVRFAATQSANSIEKQPMSLMAVIGARIARLSPEAQDILAVVSLAAWKLPQATAIESSATKVDHRRALLELRAGLFVRTTGIGDNDTIEPYHDKVREAAVASLSQERQLQLHLSLALSLDRIISDDNEFIFALAHHYFLSQSTHHVERSWECNRKAARQAAQNYAFDQAYTYYKQAEVLGDRIGNKHDTEFYKQLADSATRTGHANEAFIALDKALERSQSKTQRAELFLASSRVALGRLDTQRARKQLNAALRELEISIVQRSIPVLMVSFYRSQHALKRMLQTKALEGDALDRCLLLQRIGIQDTYVCYFEMDIAALLQTHISTLENSAGSGSSAEVAACFIQRALLCAVLGQRRWTEQTIEYCNSHLAKFMQDPLLNAHFEMVQAVIHNFLGDTVLAQTAMIRCLDDSGHLLENQDFFTATADLSWNLMMRGYAKEAWTRIALALQREQLSTNAQRGHTYRCYSGPVLAALGQDHTGKQHLDDFYALLKDKPAGLWQQSQYLAHRILYYYETRKLGQDFESAATAFADLKHSPKRIPQQMRHVYVALAYARIRQFELAPESDKRLHLPVIKQALRDLKQAARHPSLACHLALANAKFARLIGKTAKCRSKLKVARTLAEKIDNAWVLFLVDFEFAILEWQADSAEAQSYFESAETMCLDHGWKHRLADLRACRSRLAALRK